MFRLCTRFPSTTRDYIKVQCTSYVQCTIVNVLCLDYVPGSLAPPETRLHGNENLLHRSKSFTSPTPCANKIVIVKNNWLVVGGAQLLK